MFLDGRGFELKKRRVEDSNLQAPCGAPVFKTGALPFGATLHDNYTPIFGQISFSTKGGLIRYSRFAPYLIPPYHFRPIRPRRIWRAATPPLFIYQFLG